MKRHHRRPLEPAVRLGEILTGPRGSATEVTILEHPRMDTEATVASWFLNCPGQSPAWDHYQLSVVHLRPIVGSDHEPHISIPGSTHEVLLIALNPDKHPRPDRIGSWSVLRPLNLVRQISVPDDDAARALLRDCAQAVVNGILWAEPPLSGQTEPWVTCLEATASHYRGEHE